MDVRKADKFGSAAKVEAETFREVKTACQMPAAKWLKEEKRTKSNGDLEDANDRKMKALEVL